MMQLDNDPRKDHMNKLFQKWFRKHYPLEHTSIGYVGAFSVWNVMGTNQLDEQVFINGSSENLKFLRDKLVEHIDAELERRKGEKKKEAS